MSEEPKEYHIEKVEDFINVPEDRRADMLSEFADWIELTEPLLNIAEALEIERPEVAFVWIDDGKKERTLTVRATIKDEEN